MWDSSVFSVANTTRHLDVIVVGLMTIEPHDDEEVVGSDSGDTSSRSGLIVGDGDVALLVHELHVGTLIVYSST